MSSSELVLIAARETLRPQTELSPASPSHFPRADLAGQGNKTETSCVKKGIIFAVLAGKREDGSSVAASANSWASCVLPSPPAKRCCAR